jgi:hypothetical protein
MRLLILGAGQMACRHAAAFGAAEGCSIVAAVDSSATPPLRIDHTRHKSAPTRRSKACPAVADWANQ